MYSVGVLHAFFPACVKFNLRAVFAVCLGGMVRAVNTE